MNLQLHSERLVLTPLAPDDIDLVLEVFTDPDGTPLTFSTTSSDEECVCAATSGNELELSYQPNQHGTVTIVVTATDCCTTACGQQKTPANYPIVNPSQRRGPGT